MEKQCINVEGMLKAGPYSQAVKAGEFIFLSGVLPLDARRGLAITADIRAATALILDNIRNVLAEAGSSLEKAVKVTVFLKDMADFSAMNEVYQTYFPENAPARSCVAVRDLPGGYPVEIELVALK